MRATFNTKVHAKCILAGEHAVLRGHPALVFPVSTKFIELHYSRDGEPFQIDFVPPINKAQFAIVMQHLLKLLNKSPEDLQGKLLFENNIPIGAGMGFSAALSVCLARWVQWKNWLPEHNLFEFARQLENVFHGKSSGVDIAGAMYDGGVHYEMPGKMRGLKLNWLPQLYLSHSGKVSITSECINQVGRLWAEDANLAADIDQQMLRSVELAETALAQDETQGFALLSAAIELANQCFMRWNLLSDALQTHINTIKNAGAIACKPTGAGDGGYVLSLWNKVPTTSFEMIAVF
jgi:mevalonate kinase